jgi:hypothetical protein
VSVETAADRAAFFADFGMSVGWTVGAATTTLNALFDHGTIPQGFDGGNGRNRRATLIIRTADVPGGAGGASDRLSVDGANWLPKSLEPDGTGLTKVTLEEVLS